MYHESLDLLLHLVFYLSGLCLHLNLLLLQYHSHSLIGCMSFF